MKKASGEAKNVNGKVFAQLGIKINSQPTAKFLKNQFTVKDSQASPKEQADSPTIENKTNFLMTGALEQDSFGEGHKDTKLPKYFNVFNEDGIEKKTYYQDDQSNFAEARSLLKALDRAPGDDDTSKNRIKTNRILDGIST